MQRVERRRNVAALGLSVAVHALVVAWLLTRPDVAPPPPAPKPLARLVWLDATSMDAPHGAAGAGAAPAAVGTPLPRGAQDVAGAPPAPGGDGAKSADGSPNRSGAAAAKNAPARSGETPPTASALPSSAPSARTRTAAAPARGDGLAASAPSEPGPGGTTGDAAPGRSADTPRTTTLVPGPELLGTATEAPHGRTLHPGDLPSDEELLAEESARVTDRVDRFARAATSAARVRGGLPDPLYGAMGAALRDATAEVPKLIDTNSVKEVGEAFANSWQAGAARYGASGAPYTEPEGRLEALEKPSALAEAVAKGSPDGIALSQFFAAGARLQEFADGRAGAELYALVEIRQQGSGAVDSVTLLRPSGVVPFDRWVTERANSVAAGFSADAGARAKPYRSLWRFDGIVTFRRKLKMSELDARAAVGMMSMFALSMLSGLGNNAPPDASGPGRPLGPRMPAFVGRFDELTGEVDMVDLTNPQYDCRVTLLEAD